MKNKNIANINKVSKKRVFARLISQEIPKTALPHISGGDDPKSGGESNSYGVYFTNSSKFKGWDCCK